MGVRYQVYMDGKQLPNPTTKEEVVTKVSSMLNQIVEFDLKIEKKTY